MVARTDCSEFGFCHGKKCASQARNADPPLPGQNLHQMGRHKRSRGIRTGVLHRISPRIFLEGSRPLNLNFFNHQKCQKSNGNVNFLGKMPPTATAGHRSGLGSIPPRAFWWDGIPPGCPWDAQDASGMPPGPKKFIKNQRILEFGV